MPGVLTCRRQEKGLLEGGLDPWINVDHALITILVERWRSETHSFHLPHSEMTITLQNMEVIMGVPVDGLSVVGFIRMDDWGDLCAKLLGHRPPNRQVGVGKNTRVMERPRVKAKWLEERFSNPLPANATKVLVQ